MRHLVLIISLLCLGFTVTSCSRGAYNQTFVNSLHTPSQGMLVAVLPFENLTTHRNAGIICSELLETELYRKGVFRIVEKSRVRKWMTNNKINPSQMTETTYAQAVARALGVHAVLIGSVSEYGYQHGLKEEPTVGINVRLVSGNNANVLWASSSSDIGRGIFNRDSANETAQRVVVRMVHELMKCVKECKPAPRVHHAEHDAPAHHHHAAPHPGAAPSHRHGGGHYPPQRGYGYGGYDPSSY